MSSNRSALIGRRWAIGLLAFAIVFAGGCGGPDFKSRGAVKGKVTRGKKNLTTGAVMFMNKEGVSATANIDPEGNYELLDAPLGECKITVTVQSLPMDPNVMARLKGKGQPLPSAPTIPKEVVQVENKYSNFDSSGLSFTVQKGEQTHNIEL